MENEKEIMAAADIETRASQLAEKIEWLVKEARKKVASAANTAQVYTYYEIGRYIIEDEQGGKVRAEYGKGILKRVSERLTERLGKGWSAENLRQMRKFFIIYSGLSLNGDDSFAKIQDTVLEIGHKEIQDTVLENHSQWSQNQKFTLQWSQYKVLTCVGDPDARSFYEIEAFKQQWSKRQKTPISMLSNMPCVFLTRLCFSRNCVNGLRNSERRMMYEGVEEGEDR